MNAPTISTIMAVYNGEKFIAEAIESILAQTVPSDEIIIINDGSTDRTPQVLSQYPQITVVSQSNKGVWFSTNKAIDIATGKYLNFIDSDDIWHPDKNRQQLKHLIENPELDLSLCHLQQFTQIGQNKSYGPPQKGRTQLCMLIEKCKFMNVGKFGVELKAEAMLWFQKAQLSGLKDGYLTNVLAFRRSHKSNMTRSITYNQNLTSLARKLIEQRHQYENKTNNLD